MTDTIRIAFAVAVAENGVIGNKGQLPFRLPSDLKHFRKTTIDKPIIMGRKTYDSIGKPLDRRDNIVVTRDASFAAPGVLVAHDLASALAIGRKLAAARGADEVVIIGGAEIFRASVADTDRIYLTMVHARPEGDVFLDPFDPVIWAETERRSMPRAADDEFPADFIILDRKH